MTGANAFRTVEAFGCVRTGPQSGWTNRLIRADNVDVLAALRAGYLRDEIAAAGGIKLAYLDPPFDAGRDFGMKVALPRGADGARPNAAAEEFAFRDRGFGGTACYVAALHERFAAIRAVLAHDGALYVHCDWRLDYLLRGALDEVFGRDCFRNAIVWRRDAPGKGAKRASGQWPRNADTILYYSKSPREWFFEQQYVALTPDQRRAYRYADPNGRPYKAVQLGDYSRASVERLEREGLIHTSPSGERYKKYYLDEAKATVGAIWSDIPGFGTRTAAREHTGYPTQKPEALLERIVRASSRPGDLVADFTCGSGTTAAVCERLGRKWLAVDLGARAIRTARQRLFRARGDEPTRFEVVTADLPPAVPACTVELRSCPGAAGERAVRAALAGAAAGDGSGERCGAELAAVDDWAVDFRYGECAVHADGVFHPDWTAARSRAGRLEPVSAPYAYADPGRHRVAVRIVDRFGNEALSVQDVAV